MTGHAVFEAGSAEEALDELQKSAFETLITDISLPGRSGEQLVVEVKARWPAMPVALSDLATRAAARGGFVDFLPDACLINRYEPGARLSLHQDKNERDLDAPVVSVSLGLQAVVGFTGSMVPEEDVVAALTELYFTTMSKSSETVSLARATRSGSNR